MAREERNTSFVYYHSILSDGSIVETSTDNKEGFEEITSTKGKVSYVKRYNALTGMLVQLREKVVQFNGADQKVLEMILSDNGEKYSLSFNLVDNKQLGRYARSFAKYCPNIDIDSEISISAATKKEVNGYPKRDLFIKQNGVNLKTFYNSANLPRWAEKEGLDGKPEYDTSESDKILLNSIRGLIDRVKSANPDPKSNVGQQPIVQSPQPSSQPTQQPPIQAAATPVPDGNEDDLPF